ncbi:hypothetical protein [Flavobacterium aquicola]|uniref:Uncharacterized protein n=1 Tax=Flavobacterium aquicola TaxID=1682742 RepID=A0A3E0EGY7_9FLAO|nr:hypothetical protein [Flavobacterium aquicola]REG96276.1 hypothetical protein C8P67_11098 [Flavobacterium aquicola]
MKIISYIRNTIEFFKRTITKTIIIEPFNPKKELDHTRFEVDDNFSLKEKRGNSSLLFHMYSKENETLFI